MSHKFRGLKTELLCTRNPTTNEESCKAHSSYSELQLEAIDREGIPNWLEYSYYPGELSNKIIDLPVF